MFMSALAEVNQNLKIETSAEFSEKSGPPVTASEANYSAWCCKNRPSAPGNALVKK
jgi:hypothetical protein